MKDVLSFQIHNQEFAVEVDLIEIVSDMADITPIPNSRQSIKGVINLRGRIVPIVDITDILRLHLPSDHVYRNILVLKVDEEEIGILVDLVNNVLSIDETKLENLQSRNEFYAGKVNGVIKKDNRLIVFLDIRAVLGMEE